MTIPNRWRAISNHLVDAQVAGRMMQNQDLPAEVRSRATRSYVRAADALIAEMGALRRLGAMAAIEDFLDKRYHDGDA